MRLGVIPENPMERGVLAAALVPTPLFDTIAGLLLARTVMVAVKLNVFEALADGPLSAAAVAARCRTDRVATETLLNTLTSLRYVRLVRTRYALAPVARKWLLRESPSSLYDAILLQFLDAKFIEHMEEYILTGEPVRIHAEMSGEQWGLYQRGMRSGANLSAKEIAWRTPVPRGAHHLLDVGGSHGYYSVVLCRRHPKLQATILDLPEAVAYAAPLLEREHMGDRIRYRAGDVLTEDLGFERYDVVFMANLVHHFDEAMNRDLVRRIVRALRPGGVLVIGDVMRSRSPKDAGQIGALADLYFAVTSEAGTWSFDEIACWQRDEGLVPHRPIRLFTAPGGGLQAATKPRTPTNTT